MEPLNTTSPSTTARVQTSSEMTSSMRRVPASVKISVRTSRQLSGADNTSSTFKDAGSKADNKSPSVVLPLVKVPVLVQGKNILPARSISSSLKSSPRRAAVSKEIPVRDSLNKLASSQEVSPAGSTKSPSFVIKRNPSPVLRRQSPNPQSTSSQPRKKFTLMRTPGLIDSQTQRTSKEETKEITAIPKGFFSKRGSGKNPEKPRDLNLKISEATKAASATDGSQSTRENSEDNTPQKAITDDMLQTGVPPKGWDLQSTGSAGMPSPGNFSMRCDSSVEKKEALEEQKTVPPTIGSPSESQIKLNDFLMNPFWMNKQVPLQEIKKLLANPAAPKSKRTPSLKSCLKFKSCLLLSEGAISVEKTASEPTQITSSVSLDPTFNTTAASLDGNSSRRAKSHNKSVRFSNNAIVYHLKPYKYEAPDY